eukprot:TRINITY_DN8231_c1_g3_i3.p1 TRINITY_DN8231_c1_g3~~TRINITY_DN8231_c1_g3_i3.p1  ORF type:complete len:673 (+),score=159.83 TRINITY_DN8231_c1_g3_i3:493-2511(+)
MRNSGFFDVPYGLLEDVKEEKSVTVTGAQELKLTLKTKDLRTLIFLVAREEDLRNVIDAVSAFSTPGNPTLLFAFKYFEDQKSRFGYDQETNGWNLYDPIKEYTRMGIDTELIPNPSSPWKVSTLNSQYGLCSSYPALLAFPRKMTEQAIRGVAGFRKRGRLPAMSWCGGHELKFASLWRCSQSTEGLMGQKCQEDHAMIECIRRGPDDQGRDLLVIDLRPWKNAWVNKAGGGGFEGYPRCNLVFGGIDNIHAVRDGWLAMAAAVQNVVDGEVGSWWKDVANSCWYDYIGAILKSTLMVFKEILNEKHSVMVHCSDGWDRTAQVKSLSMMCLDSYYRTQEGFLVLIQKEWCSFGHRFRTRLALGERPTQEFSPVFIQWLECVFQLVQQFPNAFEFSTSVLLRLAHEVFTNCYGTFLCDNELERSQKVAPHTLSLWSVLLEPSQVGTWRNPNYVQSRKPLHLSACQANYVIWEAYWFRYHIRGERSKAQDAVPVDTNPAMSPTASQEADLFAPSFLSPSQPAPTLTAGAASAPPPPAAASQSSPPLVEEPPSLFTAQELAEAAAVAAAPKRRAAPTQVFGDDDDDDDIFASKTKPASAASGVKAAEEAATAKAAEEAAAAKAAEEAAAAKAAEEAAAAKAAEEAAAAKAAEEAAAAKAAEEATAAKAAEEAAA